MLSDEFAMDRLREERNDDSIPNRLHHRSDYPSRPQYDSRQVHTG